MSFDHLKQCAGCGKKLRPSDPQQSCDLCGTVYCADCKHTRMGMMRGKGQYTLIVCPKCADVNRSKIISHNPTMCN